jgi:uncharacterized caspase-like protein
MLHVLCLWATLCSSTPQAPAAPAIEAVQLSGPVRRALLVGVENYPEENRWPKLRGPRADVAALRGVLIERAGFRADDVHTLLDEEATGDSIRQGFTALIDASASGDLLLFYFAGHGSRVPDDSGTLEERDRWDETLVPFDATLGPGPCKDIRDEEIGQLIQRANRKTDQVVLIFDCCSSGTNTRAETPLGRRFLEPTRRGFGAARASAHAASVPTGSGYVPPALNYVALAACRADQSAYEMQIDAPNPIGESVEPGTKISRGVFTFHLVDALRSLPSGASYADLMIRVGRRVNQSQQEQTPILEGSLAGYVLFEPVAAAHTPRFPLEVGPSGALKLSGGRLHGLSSGDVFSVCGEDALRDNLPSRLGRLRLTQVGTSHSVAEWLDANDAARAAGMRTAFLLERSAASVTTQIAIEGDPHIDLVRALESKGIVRCVSRDDGALSLRRVDTRWVVFAADETQLPLSASESSGQEIAALAEDLTRLGNAQRIDQILRQNEASALTVECSVRHVGQNGELLDVIAPENDGRVRVDPDMPWALTVRNRSNVAIYVHLVTISPDGEIQLVATPTLDDAVYPDQEAVPAALTIEKIAAEYAAFYRAGPLRLHCIATTHPLDLASLEQGPVTLGKSTRGAEATASTPEDALTAEAWSGTRIEIWVR